MRETCLECVTKHLSQALILIHEFEHEYNYHYIYVVGHLAEAEEILAFEYPEWSARIRTIRLSFIRGEAISVDDLAYDYYKFLKEVGE